MLPFQKQNPTASPRLLIKAEEAAQMLSISPRLLWSLAQRGEIPQVRIGRSVRYDPADLHAWVQRQKVSDN